MSKTQSFHQTMTVITTPLSYGTVAFVTANATQAKANIDDKGWRFPRFLRKSGISARTSIKGRQLVDIFYLQIGLYLEIV